MKKFLAVTCCVIATLMTAACGDDDPGGGSGQKVTLLLNYVPYGEHAAFYYGVEEGFFADEGIDLEIQAGAGSGTTIQQVGEGHADFGWADTPPLLSAVGEGTPVKSIGVYLKSGPQDVISLASSGIDDPADLTGKTVAGTTGDAMYSSFPAWLESNGVDPDQVELVNVDAAGKVPALVSGRVDAILGFVNTQAPQVEQTAGEDVTSILYADTGFTFFGTGLVAADDTIAQDPELVANMVQAVRKSWEAALEDPDAAIQAMSENVDQAASPDVLKAQFDATVPLLGPTDELGQQREQEWKAFIDLVASEAGLSEPQTPDAYWDEEMGSK